jgi:hypothetical protein
MEGHDMLEKIQRKLDSLIGRRTFLLRLSSVATTLAAAVIGIGVREVYATVHVECCDLCFSPSPTHCMGSCYCTWTWPCQEPLPEQPGRCSKWKCHECFQMGTQTCPDKTCTGVICSWIEAVGIVDCV